ncbi:fructosamine kinase family protein [Mariniflexile ostreae]|uniref:Fructosamine kinase family protein n=1 Tax=Mariniflexile ostreae TaxID=1520892 RepID=A0ABV5FAG2_9FLAO
MDQGLKYHLSDLLSESIIKVSPVLGGDISKAYRMDTPNSSYFLKLNPTGDALKMFQTEAFGLQCIDNSNTIKTPKVVACGKVKGSAFLVMEFIESKPASSKDFETLGRQLAQLHQSSSKDFGLNHDNFIGSLPQSNTLHTNWSAFFAQERLGPQLELAKQKHLLSNHECPTEQNITSVVEPLFKNIRPTLVHGDLWQGNYLISKCGTPYLIDPAVYFGHHEVDIAMTKLFGGFSNNFYTAYSSMIPNDENTTIRLEIYQLYYLLVHLNLFGKLYYSNVMSILKKYF